jgi:hypothetical protein
MPLRRIALHPTLPHVAVVESDLGVTRLSVWDYRRARRLFDLALEAPPSYLTYSSTGRYLVVARDRHDGLLFLDPLTGERLPLFTAGFGIVSFVTFNSDDAVMMSYQPGGEVRYWDVGTQKQRLPVLRTEPFLTQVSISGSDLSPRAFLVGSTGRQLVLADIVQNGAVRERLPVPDILSLVSSPRGEIVALARRGSGVALLRLRYRPGSGLVPLGDEVASWGPSLAGAPTAVAGGHDVLFLGTSDGTILVRTTASEPRLFSRTELANVTDVAIRGNSVLVSMPGQILAFDAAALDLLRPEMLDPREPPWGMDGAPLVEVDRQPVSLAGGPRFAVSPEGQVWIWSPDADPGEIRLYGSGTEPISLVFGGALKSVTWVGAELYVVERSGRCTILAPTPTAPAGLAEVFSYTVPGANVMIGTPAAALIGKSSFRAGDSALLYVDRITGETVVLPDSDLLVYDLLLDPVSGGALSLGVSAPPDPRTTVREHSGSQFLQSTLLAAYRGEDTGADLAVERATGALYASLGYAVWRQAGDQAWQRQANADRAPRRIATGPRDLVSLNADGTVTAWDPDTLDALVDLYIFRDGEWLAATGAGDLVASDRGRRHLASIVPPVEPRP